MRNVLFLFTMVSFSCVGQSGKNKTNAARKTMPKKLEKIEFNRVEIRIQYPPDSVEIAGDLILLPGWNFANTLWCDSTTICTIASQNGLRVIMPQMGQSIYASQYYPETRVDLKKYPTLFWLDSAIDYLKDSMGLLQKKKFILGLSTGARGVALLCEIRPSFFNAAAALSGDYNQQTMPTDRLMTLVYGPYFKNRKRWQLVDNPTTGVTSFNTPIYLGHGAKDNIVPVSQTKEFVNSIQNNLSKELVISHIDSSAGHNFTYWRSEIPLIWQFFNNH